MMRIVPENLEFVAVVAIESVLRSKPDEALVVLNDLSHSGL